MVVFFFLANIRATVIAALSIPTSIIAAFAIIKYMGFTLNSLTLLALTLSVGIVIDDAIVVMENIFRYIEEKKYTPYQAALAATGEIGMAVLAITLSLVAVFLPIAMMEGIVGMFLHSFGITMAATIMVSMLVSFTLTPMLAARWFKGAAKTTRSGGWCTVSHPAAASSSKNQVFYHVIESVYLVVLRFSPAASMGGGAGGHRLHGHAADVVPNGQQKLRARRRLVGIPGEHSGAGRHVAGGHAGRDRADRPRHPPLDGVALHDCQRGRHRAAQSLPRHGLRAAGQHRRPRVRPIGRSWTSCGRTC